MHQISLFMCRSIKRHNRSSEVWILKEDSAEPIFEPFVQNYLSGNCALSLGGTVLKTLTV